MKVQVTLNYTNGKDKTIEMDGAKVPFLLDLLPSIPCVSSVMIIATNPSLIEEKKGKK